MKVTVISSSVLGGHCWSAARVCGGECLKVDKCRYPEERKTCKAHMDKRVYRNERIFAKDQASRKRVAK